MTSPSPLKHWHNWSNKMNYSAALELIESISKNPEFNQVENQVLSSMQTHGTAVVSDMCADFLACTIPARKSKSYIYRMATVEDGALWVCMYSKQAIIAFAKCIEIHAPLFDKKIINLRLVTQYKLSNCKTWGGVKRAFHNRIIREFSDGGRCLEIKYTNYDNLIIIRDGAHDLFTFSVEG
jgi:hypothetical protein